MGVYHLAGLGTSIGAVTAAFSYLSTRKENAGPSTDDPIFALSGESQDEAGTRGSVEGLVLFTTAEIIQDQIRCSPYKDNRAGNNTGSSQTNQPFHRTLKSTLKEVMRPLARLEQDGKFKPLLLYWCEYDRTNPVQTFEHTVQVLSALKPPGKVGKEIWINLTGGSNIINSALHLAASLTGTTARLYYLLSDNPDCIRHTTPLSLVGTKQDRFWVDLPMIYLAFNPVQRIILELLSDFKDDGPIFLHDLHDHLRSELYANPQLMTDPANDLDVFVHGYLRPLCVQQLVIYEETRDVYCLGSKWPVLATYLNALSVWNDENSPDSLSKLVQNVHWLTQEKLEWY